MELVLTGRGMHRELVIADLVTEMREIKHPYKDGVLARKGGRILVDIDFIMG